MALVNYESHAATSTTSSQLRMAMRRFTRLKHVRISLPPLLISSLQMDRTTLSNCSTPCCVYFSFTKLPSNRLPRIPATSFSNVVAVCASKRLSYGARVFRSIATTISVISSARCSAFNSSLTVTHHTHPHLTAKLPAVMHFSIFWQSGTTTVSFRPTLTHPRQSYAAARTRGRR